MTHLLKRLWCCAFHHRHWKPDGRGLLFYDRHRCTKCGTLKLVDRGVV